MLPRFPPNPAPKSSGSPPTTPSPPSPTKATAGPLLGFAHDSHSPHHLPDALVYFAAPLRPDHQTLAAQLLGLWLPRPLQRRQHRTGCGHHGILRFTRPDQGARCDRVVARPAPPLVSDAIGFGS